MSEPARHLAFVGMAGVGKSAMSRRVGVALGRPVVDIDALVVEAAGRTIPEIFSESGEPEFRRLESEALAGALAADVPSVIATGGGIVEAPANREALAAGALVVLLTADDDVLLDRLRNSSNKRPLLEGDLEANVAALRARRDHLYESSADLVVTVGITDLATTAGRVLGAIIQRWPVLAAEREAALSGTSPAGESA